MNTIRPEPFARKSWGRIFVTQESDVQRVRDIIQVLDQFEFEYLGKDLVAVYSTDCPLVYTHKFEMDKNALAQACLERGICVWMIDGQPDPLSY